jgi:hypothetical protein
MPGSRYQSHASSRPGPDPDPRGSRTGRASREPTPDHGRFRDFAAAACRHPGGVDPAPEMGARAGTSSTAFHRQHGVRGRPSGTAERTRTNPGDVERAAGSGWWAARRSAVAARGTAAASRASAAARGTVATSSAAAGTGSVSATYARRAAGNTTSANAATRSRRAAGDAPSTRARSAPGAVATAAHAHRAWAGGGNRAAAGASRGTSTTAAATGRAATKTAAVSHGTTAETDTVSLGEAADLAAVAAGHADSAPVRLPAADGFFLRSQCQRAGCADIWQTVAVPGSAAPRRG